MHWKIGLSPCRALTWFPPSSDPARARARGCCCVSEVVGKPQRTWHQKSIPKWLVLGLEKRNCARARADVEPRSAGERVADTRSLGDTDSQFRNVYEWQSAASKTRYGDPKQRKNETRPLSIAVLCYCPVQVRLGSCDSAERCSLRRTCMIGCTEARWPPAAMHHRRPELPARRRKPSASARVVRYRLLPIPARAPSLPIKDRCSGLPAARAIASECKQVRTREQLPAKHATRVTIFDRLRAAAREGLGRSLGALQYFERESPIRSGGDAGEMRGQRSPGETNRVSRSAERAGAKRGLRCCDERVPYVIKSWSLFCFVSPSPSVLSLGSYARSLIRPFRPGRSCPFFCFASANRRTADSQRCFFFASHCLSFT
jgi:hypothetical protein